MVLLGNKSDLGKLRVVESSQAEELAKQYNIKYFEVSAKENKNIKEAFNYVGEEFIKQHYENDLTMSNIENLHNGYL